MKKKNKNANTGAFSFHSKPNKELEVSTCGTRQGILVLVVLSPICMDCPYEKTPLWKHQGTLSQQNPETQSVKPYLQGWSKHFPLRNKPMFQMRIASNDLRGCINSYFADVLEDLFAEKLILTLRNRMTDDNFCSNWAYHFSSCKGMESYFKCFQRRK